MITSMGFAQKGFCETQLTMLIEEIHRNLKEGKQTDIILLGFSKAIMKSLSLNSTTMESEVEKSKRVWSGKYNNHKPQTTSWHREEEPLNHHETPGRQIKQSNQLSLPNQADYNTGMDIK